MSFDQAAKFYDRTRGYDPASTAKAVAFLADNIEKQKNVLDVGVGSGRFAAPLQRLGFTVAGVDVSREMLKVAAENVRILTLADARSLPFASKAFGSTVSVHLFHLVANWENILAEIMRVTQNNLLTVFDDIECRGVDPREEYRRLAGGLRYPGLHESSLIPLAPPYRLKLVATEKRPADELLQHLKDKRFSYQWKVPDPVHRKAIRNLNWMRGETLTCRVYACAWKVRSLETFLEAMKKGFFRPANNERAEAQ